MEAGSNIKMHLGGAEYEEWTAFEWLRIHFKNSQVRYSVIRSRFEVGTPRIKA
jgi:hypothetical protein